MFRILLVDDEAEEREGISFLIQKYKLPLRITEAQNGQKASEYLKAHAVDILFTDVKMPYKDGLELAKETFEQYPKIKIVIFSAYGEFEYARKAMEAHAVDYLLKPIELDAFEKIMNKVIEDLTKELEQSRHEEEQRKASKKSLFYTVFTGGNLTGFEKGQLEEYFQKIKGGRKLIINIESGENIFEQNETIFLKLLSTYLLTDYEY
ncbi:MAG: response regulator, partial [Hungatella sp.]